MARRGQHHAWEATCLLLHCFKWARVLVCPKSISRSHLSGNSFMENSFLFYSFFFLSGTQTSLSPRTPSSSTPSPIALKKWHGHATTRRISSTCTLAWSPGSKSTTVPTRYSHLLLNALSVEHWVLKTDNSPPGLKCTGIRQKARLSQLCSGFHKVLFTLCICNYSDNIQYPAQVTCSCINIPTTDQSDHICPCQYLL